MSSEENKSKSEEIKKLQSQNEKFNTLSNNINEENESNSQQIKREFKTSDLFEEKNENLPIQNSNKNLDTPVKFNLVWDEHNIPTNENKKNYFKSKKVNQQDKKDNLDKLFCNCTKTKCLKKYCECFANNRYCRDCNCVDCMNKMSFLNNNVSNSSKELSDNGEVFCTCTKSNCNKKYCECYKINKKCNEKCRCVNCLNNNYPIFNINNKDDKSNSKTNSNDISNTITESKLNEINKSNMDLDKKKSESLKSSVKEEEDLDESYQIQRISIFIRRNQTTINVERFTKEDMMLLSKKRKSSK